MRGWQREGWSVGWWVTGGHSGMQRRSVGRGRRNMSYSPSPRTVGLVALTLLARLSPSTSLVECVHFTPPPTPQLKRISRHVRRAFSAPRTCSHGNRTCDADTNAVCVETRLHWLRCQWQKCCRKKMETTVRRLCTVAKEIKRSQLRLWRTFMFSIVFIILSEN